MRYYGMSNKSAVTPVLDTEEKPAVSPYQFQEPMNQPSPTEPQIPNTQSREFNRPQNQTGIYNGQMAQNVTEVMPQNQNMTSSEKFSNQTIYQYPAGQTPPQPDLKCDIKTDFKNHLCTHLGNYLYVELLNGGEKNGMLTSVGENFITLRDGTNHIMCPFESINSISIYNYTK